MSEQFLYKSFNEIDINDIFFDSLKNDYTEFEDWFSRKKENDENAFIQIVNGSLEGFLYLKEEKGPINDISPILNCDKALKIGTFKIVPHGTRLGERFIKKSIDFAINKGIDYLYVTIFSHHGYLLNMFLKYGFIIHGSKTTQNGEENVLVKRISEISNDSLLDYPKINTTSKAFLLGIKPEFHTNLFPDSKLFNESFDVIKDVSHTNSITKVYIAKMRGMSSIRPGDNLIIYRTSDGLAPARFRSVATTACTVLDTKHISSFKTLDALKDYCKNYSIFDDRQLNDFRQSRENYYVIKMIYNVSLNKRIIQGNLIDDIGLSPAYWGFFQLTNSQFNSILELGEVNKTYLI
ncbi:N-acetyltransferase [Clostridium tertium]|uniref:N-acetyltransferase n=1 Tax=Clostridium tertium TaxID=1559 RepID=UPI00232C88B3|nr:N-acetyltransferase [Clostridium tertium]MDB1943711.1 N-acetyltransferase [Clostridium tertium]MDB1951123.1 N-acetyltransferase [Clostridium tertium]